MSSPPNPATLIEDQDRLTRRCHMAAGRQEADLCIVNAKIVDVFTRTVHEGRPVLIGDGVFLGFHEGPAKERVDARKACMVPGLIDAHVHIESSLLTPQQFARLVLPHGTTTVVADPHEIANVLGVQGIRYMLDCAERLPLELRIMLPSCVPATPFEHAGAVLNAADIAPLMSHPKVSGLAEMMNYPGVINADSQVLAKLALARAHGKCIDGHSPALDGADLDVYAAMGISTDHECTNLHEMQARLERGMYVLLRQGSASRDLPTLVKGVTAANAHRCLLCTDDRHASDILKKGHIDRLIRLCVHHGLDPLLAVCMASLHAAQCYGLRHKGAIAPGRDADFVLVDTLKDFNVREVYAQGVKVAEHSAGGGKVCVPLDESIPPEVMNTVNIAPLNVDNFALPVPTGLARVIGVQAHSLVTKALQKSVIITNEGLFDSARNPELTKVAVIERHQATGSMALGLLHGYTRPNLRLNGAIATTIAHDSHNIVVAGDADADMLHAVHALQTMGGGIVLVRDQKVVGSLPLPVAGLMTDLDAEEVSQRMEQLITQARRDFAIHPQAQPFMTLSFMALPVIPELKLTDQGLFDVRNFCFVPLTVGEL